MIKTSLLVNFDLFSKLFALCFLVSGLFSLLLVIPLEAAVTGACNHCHTMHNSQRGQPMAVEYSRSSTGLVEDSTPNPALLINNCIGCHFNSSSTTIDSYSTPIVLNAQLPSNPLAGGNFYYVAEGLGSAYNTGHNVRGISEQESPPMDVPPGFLPNITLPDGSTGPGSWDRQLTCSGTYGCHGNRTIQDETRAVFGGHHGNITIDDTSPADEVYNSYRFLLGIQGAEDDDWEFAVASNDHNGYQGESVYGGVNTISYFCGECHGNYHAHINLGGTYQVGDSTPWLRHPTDFAFNGVQDGNYATSEYAQYNIPNTNIYNPLAPVAEVTPSTSNPTVSSASIVMCLSCHRAHASPHFKLMRWDYKGWPGCIPQGCINGCNICHTSKN